MTTWPSYTEASAVYQAARAGNVTDLVHAIKNEGYDPHKMEINGSTALHAASFYGHTDCVVVLLHESGDPHLKNARYQLSSIEEARNPTIKLLLQEFTCKNGPMDLGGLGTIPPGPPFKPTLWSTATQEFKDTAKKVADYFVKKHPHCTEVGDLMHEGAEKPDNFLVAYTAESPFYRELNEALFKNVQDPPDWRDFVEQATNVLATVMGEHNKETPYEGTLWRGQHMGNPERQLMKPGFRYAFKQFTSTSKKEEVALGFAAKAGTAGALIKINGIGDQKEYYSSGQGPFPVSVEAISKFTHEAEVLFPPGSGFEVASAGDGKNFTVTLNRMPVLPHLKDIYAKHGLVCTSKD